MAIQPTSPPSVSELPPAPNSATDTPSEFDSKANNTVSAQVAMIPQINSANDWVETTAQQVYNNAIEAEASATNSEESAQNSADSASISQNAGNILGEWSGLTGSVSIGKIALHLNGRWQATKAIADVTASEPSLSNPDWTLISYINKSLLLADSEVMTAVAINEINATQSNPLPLASSVPANNILQIIVPKQYTGIETTHICSGSDTITSDGTDTSIILKWLSGGVATFASNGVDNWRRI